MMPDNPDLWRRFVSNPLAGKGMPDDVQAGEKRIFLSLREDQNLRGIYVHELQGRTIYSQNVLDVREAKVGDMTVVAAKGRVYLPHLSPMEARFEDRIDTPFKETRSGGGASGAVPKNGRLSPECDFAIQLGLEAGVNDVVSTYRENFLRYVDRVVAAPDINPLFKAYLHYKLGELLRFRPEAWGLGWTDFEHDHESLGAAGAAKLASGDWMVPRKVEQMSKPIVEYYQKLGETRYYALAVVLPVLYDRLFTGGFAYAGCVRPDGTIHLERPGADKRVWGLNAQMRVASFQADDPKAPVHPYSPLYREKLNLRDLLQSTCTKYGVQPDDAPFASKLPVFLR